MAAADGDVFLLVEDDLNDQILIRRSFQKASSAARLVVANDGDEAVSYLTEAVNAADPERFPLPRLTMLDLKLPRRSGMEVLAWIRQQPALTKLPVVVLSSSRQGEDIRKAYALGVNLYLVKPVDLGELETMIAQVASEWAWLRQ